MVSGTMMVQLINVMEVTKMKVVVNRCFGGFGLSDDAILLYGELSGRKLLRVSNERFPTFSYFVDPNDDDFYARDILRDDPILVSVVETLGRKANGSFAELAIVDIPDDADWYIEEYDGSEHIAEKHRTW